jgi:hypothetical protein
VLIAQGTANAVGEIVVVVVLVVLVEFEYFSDVVNELFELELGDGRNNVVLLDGLGPFTAVDTKLLDEIALFDGVDELVGEEIRLELDKPLLVFENGKLEDGSEVVVNSLSLARIAELLSLDNCWLDDVEM